MRTELVQQMGSFHAKQVAPADGTDRVQMSILYIYLGSERMSRGKEGGRREGGRVQWSLVLSRATRLMSKSK